MGTIINVMLVLGQNEQDFISFLRSLALHCNLC